MSRSAIWRGQTRWSPRAKVQRKRGSAEAGACRPSSRLECQADHKGQRNRRALPARQPDRHAPPRRTGLRGDRFACAARPRRPFSTVADPAAAPAAPACRADKVADSPELPPRFELVSLRLAFPGISSRAGTIEQRGANTPRVVMALQAQLATNSCLYSARNRPPSVAERCAQAAPGSLGIWLITWDERCFGANKSHAPVHAHAHLARFAAGVPLHIPGADTGKQYGEIRALLERAGTPAVIMTCGLLPTLARWGRLLSVTIPTSRREGRLGGWRTGCECHAVAARGAGCDAYPITPRPP